MEGNGLDEEVGFTSLEGVSGGDKGGLKPELEGKHRGSGVTGLKTPPANGIVRSEEADGR
jgi:hypothetical protein